MTDTKQPDRGSGLVAELTKTFAVFVYLALFLGAFTTYRRLLSAEHPSGVLPYGCSIAEALVLAKVIVVGDLLQIGRRFDNRPLVIPILYKALSFSVLILAFSVLEHLTLGWFHGKDARSVFYELLHKEAWETLARSFVKVLALLPLFAFWELGRVLGDERLFELFLTRGTQTAGQGFESRIP